MVTIVITAYKHQGQCFIPEVPENIIQDVTGHRSMKALRKYERGSNIQQQAASCLLTGTSSQNFADEVKRIELEKHVQTKTATVDCSGSKISMPTISPVISGSAKVNIFSPGNTPSKNIMPSNKDDSSFNGLFKDVDLNEFFCFKVEYLLLSVNCSKHSDITFLVIIIFVVNGDN